MDGVIVTTADRAGPRSDGPSARPAHDSAGAESAEVDLELDAGVAAESFEGDVVEEVSE